MSFWERHKDRILTWGFSLYVAVLAVGTIDQVFLDSMIFAPALDRQILGQVDVLRTRDVRSDAGAREEADAIRERLAGIRLEQEEPPLEKRLRAFAQGSSGEDWTRLFEEARQQAVANLVDNDEFSLKICIRALDPDFVMKLWVPGLGSDDVQAKQGCLEALKKISGKTDGLGYDPKAPREAQRQAIAAWWQWYDTFMEERRRPAPPVQPAPAPAPTAQPAPAAPAP